MAIIFLIGRYDVCLSRTVMCSFEKLSFPTLPEPFYNNNMSLKVWNMLMIALVVDKLTWMNRHVTVQDIVDPHESKQILMMTYSSCWNETEILPAITINISSFFFKVTKSPLIITLKWSQNINNLQWKYKNRYTFVSVTCELQ